MQEGTILKHGAVAPFCSKSPPFPDLPPLHGSHPTQGGPLEDRTVMLLLTEKVTEVGGGPKGALEVGTKLPVAPKVTV